MKSLALLPLLLVACASDPDGANRREPGPQLAWIETAERTQREYPNWGRFDELARWAPEMCWMPPADRARLSASRDTSTHGRKLYSLYAKDPEAYADEGRAEAPVGQVLVKESFHPEPLPAGTLPENFPYVLADEQQALLVDEWMPYVRDDAGREFRAGERGPLFLMMKFAADTPDTDRGWVYATVDPAGVVTSAGALASCIACHERAARDRQFGLPPR